MRPRLPLALLLAFVTAAAACAAAAQAGRSAAGPLIAFTHTIGSSVPTQRHEIWLMEADGTNRRKLVALGAHASAPLWSPDGSLIAFTRGTIYLPKGGAYVIKADGTGLHSIGAGEAIGWLPDGRVLVRRPGNTIISVNADGSGQTYAGRGLFTAFGGGVAFGRDNVTRYSIILRGKPPTTLTKLTGDARAGEALAVAPDGSSITYLRRVSGALVVVRKGLPAGPVKVLGKLSIIPSAASTDLTYFASDTEVGLTGQDRYITRVQQLGKSEQKLTPEEEWDAQPSVRPADVTLSAPVDVSPVALLDIEDACADGLSAAQYVRRSDGSFEDNVRWLHDLLEWERDVTTPLTQIARDSKVAEIEPLRAAALSVDNAFATLVALAKDRSVPGAQVTEATKALTTALEEAKKPFAAAGLTSCTRVY